MIRRRIPSPIPFHRSHSWSTIVPLLVLLAPAIEAAEIRRETPFKYSVTGVIVAGDTRKLMRLVPPITGPGGSGFNVILDSPGGDVEEAMSLGRFLRERHASASVGYLNPEATCASACVFVLAGPVSRSIAPVDENALSNPAGPTRIVIHRPYLETTPSVPLNTIWARLVKNMRAYLSEMNVPEGLADLMISISPEVARPMTQRELQFFLPDLDPTEDERLNAIAASELGLSPGEYRRQNARAGQRCMTAMLDAAVEKGANRNDISVFVCDCPQALILGIPLAELKKRKELADAKCGPLSDTTSAECRRPFLLGSVR